MVDYTSIQYVSQLIGYSTALACIQCTSFPSKQNLFPFQKRKQQIQPTSQMKMENSSPPQGSDGKKRHQNPHSGKHQTSNKQPQFRETFYLQQTKYSKRFFLSVSHESLSFQPNVYITYDCVKRDQVMLEHLVYVQRLGC